MTEHQKLIQNKFRKITESSRMVAAYETEIRAEEERAERSDSVSCRIHKKRADELRKKMKSYQKDVEMAKSMIDSIPDDNLGKRILSMRYLQLMRMEDIAVVLSYERTHLYRVYYKALESVQQKQQ